MGEESKQLAINNALTINEKMIKAPNVDTTAMGTKE